MLKFSFLCHNSLNSGSWGFCVLSHEVMERFFSLMVMSVSSISLGWICFCHLYICLLCVYVYVCKSVNLSFCLGRSKLQVSEKANSMFKGSLNSV